MLRPECADISVLAGKVNDLPFVRNVEIDQDNVLHVGMDDGSVFTLDPENRYNNLAPAVEQDVKPISPEDIAASEELRGEIITLTDGAASSEIPDEETGQDEQSPWDGFADLMEIDEAENTEIDFPDQWDEQDTPTDNENEPKHTATASGSRSDAPRVVLNRYNIGIWDPWTFEDLSLIKDAIRAANGRVVGRKIDVYDINVGPVGLSSFSNYDIVFMICHGTPEGALSIPASLWSLYISDYVYEGKDGKTYANSEKANRDGIYLNYSKEEDRLLKSIILQSKYLDARINRLGSTIVWAAVCHGGKADSQLKNVILKKGCPAFVGADNVCTLTGISSAFKPYIGKLFLGGNSSLCFNNGTPSATYTDNLKDNKTTTYKLEHTSSACVSYFRSFTLGPVRNVIKTADVKVRFVYGSGSLQGPKFGIMIKNESNGRMYKFPFQSLFKVNTNIKRWSNCALVYDAVLRIKNLTPETNYSYCTYVSDGQKTLYSHIRDYFHTDGFTGYYRFKSLRKNWGSQAYLGDEVYENNNMYWHFTSDKFVLSDKEYSWRMWNTRVEGSTIKFETWIYPYFGECGGTWDSYFSGPINEDWNYFRTVSKGWETFWEGYCPAGSHHHDMSKAIDYYWYQKIPTEYKERMNVKQMPQTAPSMEQFRTIGDKTVSAPFGSLMQPTY